MYSFLSLVLPNHESSPVPLHCRTFPIRGFQIYDGPVRLTQSTFRGYMPTPERYTSAVGFNLKNTWQLTPRNNLSELNFHSTVSRHLGLIRHRTLCSFCSKNSKTPTWPLTTLFSPFFFGQLFFHSFFLPLYHSVVALSALQSHRCKSNSSCEHSLIDLCPPAWCIGSDCFIFGRLFSPISIPLHWLDHNSDQCHIADSVNISLTENRRGKVDPFQSSLLKKKHFKALEPSCGDIVQCTVFNKMWYL